jgi:hypothetical protein
MFKRSCFSRLTAVSAVACEGRRGGSSGWRGPVPRAVWGPPRFPGCYYEKRRHAWVEACVLPG